MHDGARPTHRTGAHRRWSVLVEVTGQRFNLSIPNGIRQRPRILRTHVTTPLVSEWPPSSTSLVHWASCSLPHRPTPSTSTMALSTGGRSSCSGQPVSHRSKLARPRTNPRTSQPPVFKTEAWVTLAVLIYVLGWYLGKSANAKIANDW